jgi:hypothetical protein
MLPKYLSRADVTVQMSYYTGPCGTLAYDNGIGCATFELWDIRKYTHGKKQAVITEPDGIQYFGLLDMRGQKTMSWEITWPKKIVAIDGNIIQQENMPGYPSYAVVSAWGITEVIEHRHLGDVFYIDDDPAVRAKLGLAVNPNRPNPEK